MYKKILNIFILFFIAFSLIQIYILKFSQKYIYENASEIPKVKAVLVLGAKVYSKEVLSSILKDRLDNAIDIYKQGKAEKFLLSGDHGTQNYDEVNAMKNYLLENKISSKDIFLDHAGFDTYDSIYRARDIFGIKSIIISTQEFHLPRAVYIAKKLGLETYGASADKQIYANRSRNNQRELLARVKAFIDINIHSKPKFLGEKIPIDGDSRKSWDEVN
ncbi:hypothetical protein A2483_00255 [Candidatus Peregrinibacteria bacterium RIFOXYC2_FULL_33_13]|nr:MAG: hypothetical protein UR27_C0004G0016 [Candidatus Peregrinibacteria bacterium GW2011_GWA2_33_10]KKP41183.1 MAG: hypothetical protein UR30_C0001G0030 [Candidatus Peregrinibacteria bacterium GW2011_GWC2_33_13]OGJ50577.1 MAG: hypothetical protein A2229_02055 [Candidatus Peregrinibacteria bacterium RIFOXYA2_FULL_33_7]OGJ53570.1 MAG: hypothetical protein A2483_00255 [Candidatus Peregrinibacteria bacterium RIFOXYC2_FULL_33_13]